MSGSLDQRALKSHSVSSEPLAETIERHAARIRREGDKPYVSVARQLELLEQLSQFEFGQFLLQNQGINGYWTHYMLTHPWRGRVTGKNQYGQPLHDLEKFILDRAPTMLATQQRFMHFLSENQKAVKNHARLACIPSGSLGELLYLDYAGINQIELIGIDYDAAALSDAHALAEKLGLSHFTQLMQGDAWQLHLRDEFDLISSNGLNIYEEDEVKVTELYRQFYTALKPGGKLVTSFLTFAPQSGEDCEWRLEQINQQDLLLQKIIFVDILEAKWRCYRSSAQTRTQLEAAGFRGIEFIYDDAHLFPTVIAHKS
ncbi:hypothetical protein AQUSIP_10630 [Aquicella siphonis]|uniref:Methyltransferase domain-containing protein n=1 Tax=Aquicella siphonis TaxID=254247 RepID=A0A5E4PFL0_9COXI|nr:methyltransferase domain-containing protein [Aquicella siphonis]VVC75769.1 hypothetical protein AQUSIP_10630 [Aquicella siphonis]